MKLNGAGRPSVCCIASSEQNSLCETTKLLKQLNQLAAHRETAQQESLRTQQSTTTLWLLE